MRAIKNESLFFADIPEKREIKNKYPVIIVLNQNLMSSVGIKVLSPSGKNYRSNMYDQISIQIFGELRENCARLFSFRPFSHFVYGIGTGYGECFEVILVK